jgi:hypothetical protein
MKISEPVEIITKSSGLLSVFALILSIIYDWGYFYAIGISFAEIPTSISDHIRSALLWLPNTILAIFLVLTFEYINQRVERGLTEEEIVNSSKNPEKLKKFRNGPALLFRIFAPAAIVGFLLMGDTYSSILPLALIITWTMLCEWLTNSPLIKLRRSEASILLFKVLPMVFFYVFFMGYNSSTSLAKTQKANFLIQTLSEKEPVKVSPLRYFDRGVLVLKTEINSIYLIPWSQITSIQAQEPYHQYTGVLGQWFKSKNTSNPKIKADGK